jgi:pyruvate carboxylase
VHTHDTAGSGVASMLAAADAGADVVDVAIDAMSGMTSQPSLGAIVANLKGGDLDTGIDPARVTPLNTYWENVRGLYVPFESGQLSTSSDVYQHEIPGGQYTNLLYQSRQLGLTERWPEIKRMYAVANKLLGDIPKVTPSSKVVGDLAQFMVSQNLTPEQFEESADTLALPDSVVSYFQGTIGVPPGGFPEPLRSKVLAGAGRAEGAVEGRPGASMAAFDFDESERILKDRWGDRAISDVDVLSHALYPKVFDEWQQFKEVFGDVAMLPTHLFLKPMTEGEEVTVPVDVGREVIVKMVSVPPPDSEGIRKVIMELNGERWFVPITDQTAANEVSRREKAVAPGDVGSPMPGVVVDVKVKVGDVIKEGDQIAVLSAMKMETVIPATKSGEVTRLLVNAGDNVEGDDLLAVIS